MFSRQSTGETTQNRDVVSVSILGEGLLQTPNRESVALAGQAAVVAHSNESPQNLDRHHIHRLLIDPGIEPVNENVVEENSSSNHTGGGRSPADRSQQNLRRLFTVHTTSSINDEGGRASPIAAAGVGDDTSKS